MQYHDSVEQIVQLLISHNAWFEKFVHEPVRTSDEAAKVRHGYSLHQGAKAIIVRIKTQTAGKKFVMLVLPGDAKFNNSKAKQLLTAKDLRFATENEVLEITAGVQPGGVPPFGNIFNLEVIVDPTLLKNENIVFNAGDKRVSIAMKSQDYLKIVNPRIAEII